MEDSWSYRKAIVFVLLFGWIGALLAADHVKTRQEFGRDVSVDVPLRVSAEARRKLLNMRRQRPLKRLLSQVDVYAELLREYPQASVEPLA